MYSQLADSILQGHRLTKAEGLELLRAADADLLDMLAAAYRVRRHWFADQVQLNFLVNAKSGQCGEDCGYCSQSRVSTAPIARYALLSTAELVDGARMAAERQARTYCMVTSGRQPSQRELEALIAAVTEIKRHYGLRLCVSPGFLTPAEAARLKAAGADRVNHNLNTSERFYPTICTTHTWQERLETLRAVRSAGMEICSGGIVGMGETDEDVVELALRLGELEVEAVPVNFLQPIAGTPLGPTGTSLTPRYCLKVLVLFRLANPRAELRIAAGREMHLRSLQPLGLFAANSIFVGDYLTTQGQPAEDDYRMLADLGFEPVVNE
jgi:biotin synthase